MICQLRGVVAKQLGLFTNAGRAYKTGLGIGKRPNCACGKPCRRNGARYRDQLYWYPTCTPCGRHKVKAHRRGVDRVCAECGFVCARLQQMDRHHVNGDHADNRPGNLVTLCANCHRLKG